MLCIESTELLTPATKRSVTGLTSHSHCCHSNRFICGIHRRQVHQQQLVFILVFQMIEERCCGVQVISNARIAIGLPHKHAILGQQHCANEQSQSPRPPQKDKQHCDKAMHETQVLPSSQQAVALRTKGEEPSALTVPTFHPSSHVLCMHCFKSQYPLLLHMNEIHFSHMLVSGYLAIHCSTALWKAWACVCLLLNQLYPVAAVTASM